MIKTINYKCIKYFSAFAASLGGLAVGTVVAWSSNILYLKPQNDLPEFSINTEDLPLVNAMSNLGATLFAVPGGIISDYMGRTPTMLFAMLLFLINWVMIAFAKNLPTIIVARFLGGMAMGTACVVCNMYLLEISSVKNRALCLGFSFMIGAGIFLMNFIAQFTSWPEYHLIPGAIPIIFTLCYFIIPESPTYLVAQHKIEDAKNKLFRVRGSKDVFQDLKIIQEDNIESNYNKSAILRELFFKKSNFHALIAGIGVSTYQRLSDIDGFNFYAPSVFKASSTFISTSILTIILRLIQALFVIGICFFLNKTERKNFLILSASIMSLGQFGLGLYFQLKENHVYIFMLEYFPIIFTVIYMIGFSLGYSSIPWLLASELFTSKVRAYAVGIMVIANWGTAFLVTYAFPNITTNLGYYLTFYMFGSLAVFSIFFVVWVVPETKENSVVDVL